LASYPDRTVIRLRYALPHGGVVFIPILMEWFYARPLSCWFYLSGVVGGNCHYWHPDRDVVAGHSGGTRIGPAGQLFQQLAAVGYRREHLRRAQQRAGSAARTRKQSSSRLDRDVVAGDGSDH